MDRYLKIQFSVLIGILGFFLGGIVNLKKEIIDIVVNASIGWAIGFFLTFFILSVLIKDSSIDYKAPKTKSSIKNISKGKNLDIIISDNLDEIYNLKR